jgi:hypothetical protein
VGKQPLAVKFYAKGTKKQKHMTTETGNIHCCLPGYQDENYVRRTSVFFPANTIADTLILAPRLKVERKMRGF